MDRKQSHDMRYRRLSSLHAKPAAAVFAAIFVAVFALIGGGLLLSSRAATPFASLEPELASLSGCASSLNDSTASGGKAVRFSQCSPSTDPDPAVWKLDLNEQFSGSSINNAVWNVTNWNDPASNNGAVWRADQVAVTGGNLEIRSNNTPFGTYNWRSGNIQSYSPTKYLTPGNYFRAEVRAKSPLPRGFWPAPLWLRPVRDGAVVTGEIDVYEGWAVQRPNYVVRSTLHGNYTDSPHKQMARQIPFSSLTDPDPQGWHTYVVEKTPGKTETWVDGKKIGSWTATDSNSVWPAGFYNTVYEVNGTRWALRATMQIGNPGAGENPDANNDWSPGATTMLIDYIKVWDYTAN